jgi:hypothetical protein
MLHVGWKTKAVAMVCVLTLGSSSVAPEARAAGTIREVGEWIQTHQVEVSCISAGVRMIVSGGIDVGGAIGGIKCLIRILSNKRRVASIQSARGAAGEAIVFNSIEEFLAHPKVHKSDKEAVRTRYLPGLKRLEAEIGTQAKRIKRQSIIGKRKLSEKEAEDKLRGSVDPLIRDLSAPLVNHNIKVIVK